jgi:hypothetical protein
METGHGVHPLLHVAVDIMILITLARAIYDPLWGPR